jgi:flagellar biogenesis protein FliO
MLFGKRKRPKEFLYIPTYYDPAEDNSLKNQESKKKIRFHRQATGKGINRSVLWIILLIMFVLWLLMTLGNISKKKKWGIDTIKIEARLE